MSSLSILLADAFARYPLSEAKDYYKLIYQSCFGPMHLEQDTACLYPFFKEEWEKVPIDQTVHNSLLEDISLFFPIARVHFAEAKKRKMDPDVIFQAFIQTMKEVKPITVKTFRCILEESKLILKDEPFSLESETIKTIWMNGFSSSPASCHHSVQFNQTYQPHYRLIIPSFLK